MLGSEGYIGDGYGFVWRHGTEIRDVYLRSHDRDEVNPYDPDVLPAPLRNLIAKPVTGTPVRPDEVEITWMWSNNPMGGHWSTCTTGPAWPGSGVVPRASLAAFAPDGCAADPDGGLRTVGHWPASSYPAAVRAFDPYPLVPVAW